MPRPDASEKLAASKPKQPSKAPLIVAIVLVVALIAGGAFALFKSQSGGWEEATGPQNSAAGGDGITLYPGKAKEGAPEVKIYEDFQCPVCHEMEKANGKQILQMAADGDIKLSFHMMSFLDGNLNNTASHDAANAAFCATDQNRFPQYHKAVYDNQPEKEGDGYTKELLKSLAPKAGIKDTAAFDKCVDDDKYSDYVEATQKKSDKDGVRGTPTVIIDGKSTADDEATFQKLVQTPNSFKSVLEEYSKK